MSSQDFQENEKPKQKFQEIGRSGTLVTGDVIQNDYILTLTGVEAQETFSRMLLSDSKIRQLYHAVSNPIRSAIWSVEPASDSPRDIEVAALMEHILFKDIPDGWRNKLDEILTFPWHGHSVFEVIHKNRMDPIMGPYTGLSNLAFRDQRTLDQWKFSPEGYLTAIHQIQSGTIEVEVDIPAEDLIIFYNEKKGNDSGYPFCRMLYGNWKRKLMYKQLQAIGIERAAIPVPHLELPEDVDFGSDAYAAAQDQLAAFTQAEQAYFITPNGYKLNYNQTGTFDPAKTQVAIKAENEEIAGSLVAMWLEMGVGGNSAVGSSTFESLEFFKDGIVYLAHKIADTINLCLLPNLVRLNFGDVETLPKLVFSGISDEAGKELMEVVTGYANAGVIQPDEPLEDHIRKAHNLPPKAEGTMIENGESQDEPNDIEDNNDTNNNNIDNVDDENNPDDNVELSEKGSKPKNARGLIVRQTPLVAEVLKDKLSFSSAKYINDVIARYKQLSDARKQTATSKVRMGGINTFKKDLKRALTDASFKSIEMARTEVPTKSDIQLNTYEVDLLRMTEKYGDISNIELNEFSKLPKHVQVLLAKQSELIVENSLSELQGRIDFAFSGIELSTNDANVIKQAMEESADGYIESGLVNTKATNAVATMVNESRNTFFFEPEVLEEIHSFTFVNAAPKSQVCTQLAGTTFATNDAESLRYSPPLHHNCKSYLRANLKSSKGISNLEVSTLSPTAKAKESITL